MDTRPGIWRWMLCGGLAGVCTAAGQGILATSVFQRGVSPVPGYEACLDSTLRSLTGYSFGMQSLGADAEWDPRWSDSEGAGLIWFDVSAIPAYAAVTAATLRIWFEPDEFEETSGYFAVRRLGDPDGTGRWQANTNATENDYGDADPATAMGCARYKRPGTAWTAAGGTVLDVAGSAVRVWHPAGTAEWLELDVTEDVADFVGAPSDNLGWLAVAEADNTLRGRLHAHDAPAASNRPQLVVVYVVPGQIAPAAEAGTNQLLTDGDTNGWEWATLDGSGSSDLDGTIQTWIWRTGGVAVATGESTQAAFPLGTNLVELTVTDDDALSATDTVQIVVRDAPTNEPPVLGAIGNQVAWTGQTLQFAVSATDPDEDTLTCTASNLPPGAGFAARVFTWTPEAVHTGYWGGVEFWVDDGRGGSDSEVIGILVQEASAVGTTWYVRVDGGTPDQCTGRADAPYPGSGTNQPCAWDHPFRALPPGGTPRIAGGDTLIIGPGSYRMGHGAPGADACSSDYPWDCYMPSIPSGPSPAAPTRILGAGGGSGCTNKPELWGAERAFTILNLIGSTNVEIGCLELTDHEGCVENHSGSIPCERDAYPYGDWCPRGLYAEDAANVYLHDLDIHGLANTGIQAGRLTDWRVENVRVAGNGWAGWDGDIAGDDGNGGTMFFTNFVVEWNGCGESWPAGAPTGCWAQSAGGYGDGLGTGETGGEWVFENCDFSHNTSDGLDLLYVRRAGSSILIRNTIAEGNAGNQLKTSGPATIENCIAVGNCGFFDNQPFTYFVDPCRALGNTLSLALGTGEVATVAHCTITGEGDCLVLAGFSGTTPDGTERVLLRNNIFLGFADYHQPYENTCLTWGEDFASDPFDMDYSVIQNVKGDPCPTGAHDLCGSPQLADMTLGAFDAAPLSNSPAIDAGAVLTNITVDCAGVSRPLDGRNDGTNAWDIGAHEFVHPLADSDADGMRDADETVAGTDAADAAAVLALESRGPADGPALGWWGVKGRIYGLDYATEATGDWAAVVGATNLAGTNGWMGFTNPVPPTHRYFRLRAHRP